MNTAQFNSELFNQDHIYKAGDDFRVSFNGYDLFSFSCSTFYDSYLKEVSLQDVFGDFIYDVNGDLLSITERKNIIFQKTTSTTGIAVQNINFFDLPNVKLDSFESSVADGGGVINKRFGNKSIQMTLFIQGESNNDLINRIDDLKKNIQGVEGNLDIIIAGKKRRYIATFESMTVPEFKKSEDYIEGIEVSFLATSPFWSFIDAEQIFIPHVEGNLTKLVENKGTYEVYPIIKVITNSGSTLSSIKITSKSLGNTSGYDVWINDTIPEGTIVTFDYVNKTVSVLQNEVNFFGVMRPMKINGNVFDFTFTGTGIDVNVYIIHNPTFL